MKAKSLPSRPAVVTIVAAMLSVLISTGLLLGVARLFLDDGVPLQNVVAAVRSCDDAGKCTIQRKLRRFL